MIDPPEETLQAFDHLERHPDDPKAMHGAVPRRMGDSHHGIMWEINAGPDYGATKEAFRKRYPRTWNLSQEQWVKSYGPKEERS